MAPVGPVYQAGTLSGNPLADVKADSFDRLDAIIVNPTAIAGPYDFKPAKLKAAIEQAMERTIGEKRVTYDLERQMKGATLLKTSEFGEAIVGNLG